VSGTTVNALSAGTSTITATYATASGAFSAFVSAATATVSSMSLSYGGNTLTGQTGATSAGSLFVAFSDGTSFANAISAFSPLFALVGFNSSDTAFVTVSATGVASLVNNSWRFAVLTAFSKCNGVVGTYSMAGNLAPANYDTKLGSITGLTFAPQSNGLTVDATVRVQVSTSPLTTYQVWIFYNSAVFGPPTIAKAVAGPLVPSLSRLVIL